MQANSDENRNSVSSEHEHGLTYLLFRNQGYCPCHAPILARILKKTGVKPVIVRVSSKHVQAYTTTSKIYSLRRVMVERIGLKPAEKPAMMPCKSIDCLFKNYVDLLSRELFWEAHEVGEGIWRLGAPQGQYLAVVAGVFAKAQEGLPGPVDKLVKQTLTSIILNQPGAGIGVDLNCIMSQASVILSCGWPEAWKCITTPAITISYRRK
ncbi:MAG: DUF309 domain-containing protein [Crenarchaeota archaeon]|nr:DUF309 domain-containing protein [Thermoproteota archaeon]